ncbi:hypothetical protein CANARDRAFT_6379 [[Candida] arabinofermentans NRRL YB-2248]|uniref:RecQ mediated genome instability protein 1 OB-fold domain-containing protein n=1 Tax=[Candida] arabinofermentans NRRL YB-2248 TaxID=983967 RepID=A0A1E4T513_9ASCO|nr:hypothetical protein CANARDRAFT_6379 [[Candida] arabinofermentans NRRL YB-2248]
MTSTLHLQADFRFQDLTDRNNLSFKPQEQFLRSALSAFKPPQIVVSGNSDNHVEVLDKDIMFQIIGLTDLTRSGVSYIESLTELIDANEGFYDRQKKSGNGKQNNKLIRSANVGDDDEGHEASYDAVVEVGKRLYRFTLQDSLGNLCYAYEIEPLHFLRLNSDLYPIKLGSKLMIKKGTTILFKSCFQLTAKSCQFFGGEIKKLNYNLYQRELEKWKKELNYTG